MKRPISRTRRNAIVVADILGAILGFLLCYLLLNL